MFSQEVMFIKKFRPTFNPRLMGGDFEIIEFRQHLHLKLVLTEITNC